MIKDIKNNNVKAYKMTVKQSVVKNGKVIYSEKYKITKGKVRYMANTIKKKYLDFYERIYDSQIKEENPEKQGETKIELEKLEIDGNEINLKKEANIIMRISSNTKIKELNGKYNCTFGRAKLLTLPNELIKMIEDYALCEDTEVEFINVYIRVFEICEYNENES